jgi:hypothetical protein
MNASPAANPRHTATSAQARNFLPDRSGDAAESVPTGLLEVRLEALDPCWWRRTGPG